MAIKRLLVVFKKINRRFSSSKESPRRHLKWCSFRVLSYWLGLMPLSAVKKNPYQFFLDACWRRVFNGKDLQFLNYIRPTWGVPNPFLRPSNTRIEEDLIKHKLMWLLCYLIIQASMLGSTKRLPNRRGSYVDVASKWFHEALCPRIWSGMRADLLEVVDMMAWLALRLSLVSM